MQTRPDLREVDVAHEERRPDLGDGGVDDGVIRQNPQLVGVRDEERVPDPTICAFLPRTIVDALMTSFDELAMRWGDREIFVDLTHESASITRIAAPFHVGRLDAPKIVAGALEVRFVVLRRLSNDVTTVCDLL